MFSRSRGYAAVSRSRQSTSAYISIPIMSTDIHANNFDFCFVLSIVDPIFRAEKQFADRCNKYVVANRALLSALVAKHIAGTQCSRHIQILISSNFHFVMQVLDVFDETQIEPENMITKF